MSLTAHWLTAHLDFKRDLDLELGKSLSVFMEDVLEPVAVSGVTAINFVSPLRTLTYRSLAWMGKFFCRLEELGVLELEQQSWSQ